MANNKDPIYDRMGLKPLEKNNKVVEFVPKGETHHEQIEEDFEIARDNFKDLIEKGSESLEELISLAKQSQSNKAFDSVANMINAMRQVNNDFVGLSKTKKEILKEENSEEKTNNNYTQNNTYFGSTSDYISKIQDEEAEEDNE